MNDLVNESGDLVNDLVNDCISRRAAADIVRFECGEWEGLAKTITKRFEALPSAQPVNIARLQPNCNQVASDCISRAAAVDAIDEIESEVEDGYGFQYAKWREFFCNLPSTQPDLDEWCTDCKEYDKERYSCPRWNRVIRQTLDDVGQERWIPCKTRKPEKSGLYLVTKQQKTGEIQLATAHYNTAFDEWSGNGNFKKVLAWQPLPSPWRGGQDGN